MSIYLVLICVLFSLAFIDLIVGVSNDAVNFLNSAIGSKVASFKTILIVASLGILLGASFSSGMMEVARKGIFNPAFFTFDKVMIVFLAVMLTDIILLDFYNTLGLPTSTTVSLVFALLGGALVTGLLIAFDNGYGFEKWVEIINYSSALTIVSGIFLSVFISFIVGAMVQHVSRIVFTFDFERNLKRYGAVFSGIAITTIIYFLLIKGVKGSTLVSPKQIDWILAHTWVIVVISLAFWSIAIQILMWWKRINPLKAVVLLGTFSLAMAFAGNDLVNFIGVSIAGLISFQSWAASNIPATEFNMAGLGLSVVTPSWILLLSGFIMVVTLWTSAKSRKVSETEVSLSRQDEGDERFKANFISRVLVGIAIGAGNVVEAIIPKPWRHSLSKRFAKNGTDNFDEKEKPSFDLIRASVNLLVSSILIAYATSKKLPLSTTFVTFMVAMGTSFADQAWGRESAVYRVAGVINVIAGWLTTALVAFTACGFFALILYKTGMVGVFALVAVAVFLLVRSHILFKRKAHEDESANQFLSGAVVDIQEVIDESKINTVKNLKTVMKVSTFSIKSLINENKDALVKSRKEIHKLRTQNEKLHNKIIKYVKKMEKGNVAAGRLYILVFDLVQDLYQSAQLLNEICANHVINLHSPPKKKYIQAFNNLMKDLATFITQSAEAIEHLRFDGHDDLEEQKNKLLHTINKKLEVMIKDIQNDDLGNRMAFLQTRILLETKDIVAVVHRMYLLYYEFVQHSITSSEKND
ncbi:MAG: inorganic phosphate transporter [Cyclobacteriaceae bacterium]|nr:inorganic phosphate transporter [Cyclobacteriaceae bacterium]MCB0500394.1 inorganic phosphate transporter [Cyclobacteriaceae bacterium]MCB9238669.1 inorganic phosphate transporter [Flammeovirgaceae bacterium]MCO5271827.1 inorganic phosphate transporter [Cyclobacteriaceae bacterium]MCW5901171.1 inorganic phosphate transporter [Cyclobacteriaceae bacterium]